MKKLALAFSLLCAISITAQTSANEFFYELTFRPKKDADQTEKVLTTLDITKDKSLYRDYTVAAQDSILKIEVEAMQKSGTFKDLSKIIKQPKFSYKVYKYYPDMKVQYVEQMMNGMKQTSIGYTEPLKFNWKIENEKQKIGEYNAQKATTDFGGRKWVAWFSTDLPFQDGPYKFYGLPGLIVKIEDDGQNYSWILKGNKKIADYSEKTYVETLMPANGDPINLSKEKFEKTFNDYKSDPMASFRPYMTPEMLSQKMPGADQTLGEMIKEQEKKLKDFYESNNNPIELTPAVENKKKK